MDKCDMKFKCGKKKEVGYYFIKHLQDMGVDHLVTTRQGGVSDFPSNSMNLGINTSDDMKNVKRNYDIISDAFGIDLSRTVLSNQVHGDEVLLVEENHICGDFLNNEKVRNIDALVTNKKGITLVTLYADCVPVILYDPVKNACSLVHSGWKGTVKKISQKAIRTMSEEFGCDPNDIIAGIGPSIGKEGFEVSKDVHDIFKSDFKSEVAFEENGRFSVDLWEANREILVSSGIAENNIAMANLCTYSNTDEFFSYRKNKDTGRMAAMITLK